MMKKFISAVAALAMVMAFVGCGPIDFSEHTVTIKNSSTSDTAYYITDVRVVTGSQYLEASIAKNNTNPAYNVVTLKTLAPSGDATVEFKSSISGKIAVHSLSIMSSGMILTPLSPLARTTYNGEGSHLDSWWEDDTSTLTPASVTGYYLNDADPTSILLVKDNILYYLKFNKKGETLSTTGAVMTDNDIEYYSWRRGVVTQTDANKTANKASVHWDTYGRLYVHLTNHKIRGDYESFNADTTYVPTSGLPVSDLTEQDYYCPAGANPQTITFSNMDFTAVTTWDRNWQWPTTWGTW
jgi:hypothetical protein